MNTQTYRLVFNPARACLVAVAETVRGCGKGGAAGSTRARRRRGGSTKRCRANRPLALVGYAQVAINSIAIIKITPGGGSINFESLQFSGKTVEQADKDLPAQQKAAQENAEADATLSGVASGVTQDILPWVQFTTTGKDSSFLDKLGQNTVNALVSTGVNTLINGKPADLSNVVTTAVVTTTAQVGATKIGDWSSTGPNGEPPVIDTGTQLLAHAGLGCATGAALAGNASGCAPGAVGGVTGEVTAMVAKANGLDDKDTRSLATLTSTVAGSAVGGGGNGLSGADIAGFTGTNAGVYNYLDHRKPSSSLMRLSEVEEYERAVAECKDTNEACQTRDRLARLSNERDYQLRRACDGSKPDLCNLKANEAATMGNVVSGNNGGLVYANSPGTGAIRGLNVQIIGPVSTPTTTSLDKKLGGNLADALIVTAQLSPPGLVAGTFVAGLNFGANVESGNYGAATLNVVEIVGNVMLGGGATRLAALTRTEFNAAKGLDIVKELRPITPMEGLSPVLRTGDPVLDAVVLSHPNGTIWGPSVSERGALGEDLLSRGTRGIGLHNNEPVIDVFLVQDGNAVSMKTLDWNTSAKITNPGSLESTIKGQINKLVNYEGTAPKSLVGNPDVFIYPGDI